MRSAKLMTLKLLSLAAVLVGATALAACGGGGELPGGTTLLLGGPVMTAPPTGNLPDPIPMPVGDPLPIEPVPPEQPPVEPPPVPEEPPHDPDPAPVPAPDFSRVRALARVTENALAAEPPETYVGLYAGDEDGGIWQKLEGGGWNRVGVAGVQGAIEALTYVRTRHALYMVIESPVRGSLLARWLLTPAPEFQLLQNAFGEERFDNASGVTGLAFDTASETLYVWLRDARALAHVADLDVAEATFDHGFTVGGGLLDDVQDLAYDRLSGRLVLVDATLATVIELDHLGLAFHNQATIPFFDVRALALEDGGMRVAADRASAALVQFDVNGAVFP